MVVPNFKRATLADLHGVEGKAELVEGRIVEIMPNGRRPGRVAGRVYRSLDDHVSRTGRGEALGDGVGYAVPELSSGRESFCPDAAYIDGPPQADDMEFVDGPPTFAVEVRSESDYGRAADLRYATKRADYFEAGTLVVWDVDPVNATIMSYRSDAPDLPTTFVAGDIADAEPAVPGWRLDVSALFA